MPSAPQTAFSYPERKQNMNRRPNVLIINGPNLNLLGTREPHLYGTQTLDSLNAKLRAQAVSLNIGFDHFQSNSEGALIDRIHAARGHTDFIIINAGAYTHTSIALRDALSGTAIPYIEVHLSNVHSRESFRHHSYLASQAVGVIAGLGAYGYRAALEFAATQIRQNKTDR